MHMDCFEKFEAYVVSFLAKQGRARSWNESQVRLKIPVSGGLEGPYEVLKTESVGR